MGNNPLRARVAPETKYVSLSQSVVLLLLLWMIERTHVYHSRLILFSPFTNLLFSAFLAIDSTRLADSIPTEIGMLMELRKSIIRCSLIVCQYAQGVFVYANTLTFVLHRSPNFGSAFHLWLHPNGAGPTNRAEEARLVLYAAIGWHRAVGTWSAHKTQYVRVNFEGDLVARQY